MKNAGKYLTGAILVLLVMSAPLQAQVRAGGWRDLLQSRTRVAYRGTHPDPVMECGTPATASAFLIAPEYDRPIGRTWLAGPNQSTWETVRGPSEPDTLAVKIVSFWCNSTTPSLLIEAGGYYLEVAGDQLATVDSNGEVKPGILVLAGSGAALTQASLESSCNPNGCVYSLGDADAAGLQVRTEIASRLEAQRREWEAAQRNLVTSAQAASPMRAPAPGLTSGGNLFDALQRYGASEVEARAIMDRRVLVGMTQAMVRAAIGEPDQTAEQPSDQGATLLWTYPNRQVSFRSGKVTEVR